MFLFLGELGFDVSGVFGDLLLLLSIQVVTIQRLADGFLGTSVVHLGCELCDLSWWFILRRGLLSMQETLE